MKSIKLPIVGKFLILLILLASMTYAVKLNLKPEAESKSLKKPEAEAKKDLKIEFKPRTEKAKFDDRLKSKIDVKVNYTENEFSHFEIFQEFDSNSNTNSSSNSNSNSNSNTNSNTNSNSNNSTNNTNPNNNTSNNSNNIIPSNETPAADNSTEKEFYYLPQIGGVKINNPLPQNAYGCAGCKNAQGLPIEPRPASEVVFPEKPGVKFQQVKYVKELSPGGKAALELEEINE